MGAAAPPRSVGLAVGLFLAISLTAFETLAVATVLPTIADQFDGDRLYGATFVVYMLANLVSLVTAGERADRSGLHRSFLVGAGLFITGLLVAGLAPSMLVVLMGRALQGAGTGVFSTLAYVAVRRAYTTARQRRMYAVLSSGWVLPSLIAPFVAGWITDTVGWRWVFIGLVPLGVLLVVLALPALRAIDRTTVLDGARTPSRVPLALWLAAGLGALTAASYSVRWWLVAPLAVAGTGLAVTALRRLLPRGVLRARRGRPAAVAARLVAMAAFNGADFFIPLAARRFHDASPTAQGATILGAAVTWSASQWFAANQGARIGSHRLVPAGFTFLALGTVASASVLWAQVPLWATFLGWSVGGLGMGLLFNPTSHVAMSSADPETAGLASTQLNIADVTGFSLMAAVGGGLVSFADQTRLRLAPALGAVFVLATACALLGTLAGRQVRADE